ncbi:MAG: orotidine-5'-phosphate decarboxylase [Alphaproteobacteria bacterium]
MKRTARNPIWLALDTPDPKRAAVLIKATRQYVGGFKVGLEFISANGPQGVHAVAKAGLPVFADVKYHDIPNTVAGAIRAMSQLGVSIINVHAAGGAPMLKAAMAAVRGKKPRPAIVGVTVLTSLTDNDLAATGVTGATLDQVVRLAKLCQECELDGVVCSPLEIAAVRKACGPKFLIVAPGVRPKGASTDDQRRVMTPRQALQAGANILVIGRPITGAKDPEAAARALWGHIQGRVPAERA